MGAQCDLEAHDDSEAQGGTDVCWNDADTENFPTFDSEDLVTSSSPATQPEAASVQNEEQASVPVVRPITVSSEKKRGPPPPPSYSPLGWVEPRSQKRRRTATNPEQRRAYFEKQATFGS